MLFEILIFLLFFFGVTERANCTEIEDLQKEINDLNLQLEFTKVKIKSSNVKSTNYNKKIEEIKSQMDSIKKEVEQYGENVEKATLAINATERSIDESKKRIQSLMSKYRARLIQLHKIKQNTLYSSVFAAKDINSFMNRYEMVKYLLSSDKEALEKLKKEEEYQSNLKETLYRQCARGENLKSELAEKEKKLAGQKNHLEALLSTVLLEKKVYMKKQQEYIKERKNLEKSLKELNNVVERTISNDEKKSGKTAAVLTKTDLRVTDDTPAPSVNVTGEKLPENASDAAKAMLFSWPVSKELRKEVVEINDDNSCAILIALNADAEITAAAQGRVMYKGKISGLGDVVMIGHEKGFATVYAKLDNIWVGMNEKLQKGDVIGKINGGSKSAALHFEIRFGSKKQKPLEFLPE